jgi:hypothetical protein
MITNYLSSNWLMVQMDQGPDTLRWDHSYVSKGTGVTCEIVRDLSITSDHKHGLSVTIPVKNNLTNDVYLVESPLARFSITKLKENSVKTDLIMKYNSTLSSVKLKDIEPSSLNVTAIGQNSINKRLQVSY